MTRKTLESAAWEAYLSAETQQELDRALDAYMVAMTTGSR
jgi:hypothetical protein